jgi:membrane protease YdiL (CAAX protease family)
MPKKSAYQPFILCLLSSVIRLLTTALVPLLVLLAAISLACIAGYFIVLGIGDFVPFRTIISKSTQLFLILSIFPAMAYLKINKEELGFAPRPVFLKQLIQGFGLGFMTLMPVFMVLTVLKINIIDETQLWTAGLLARNMAISLLLAMIISLIEEPLFRGILLVGLHKKLPVLAAILTSSTYYAALHFLSSRTDIPAKDLNLFSGFKLLGEAIGNLLNPNILSAFFALLMVGIFLAVLRTQVKTSLGLCIGCHTCWVWQIKMSKKLFNTDYSSEYFYLVNSYDGVIGPLVTGWLMLAIAGYFVYRRLNKAKVTS